MENIPELVLPGGDLHRTDIAFKYGADAVYLGLDKHSLRKAEVRFDMAGIKKAIELAHKQKKKIYITFNIFAHQQQLFSIKNDLLNIAKLKPDAYIISDPGVVNLAKDVAPKVPIHLSTQANTLNSESVKFWQKQGVKRIVLARETSLSDIKMIKRALSASLEAGVPKMELEVFVHGSMCISYSGRCLMSSYMTGRSANLGSCTQPCRWNYKVKLEESQRPGEYFELEEDENGSYLMSSKDLCLIEYIDELAKAGVDALKIEGRNKTDYYVATTAHAYSEALASINNKHLTINKRKEFLRFLKEELLSLTRRDYTTGFLFGDAKKGETHASRQPIPGKKYAGYVEKNHKDNWSTVVVKNKLESGKAYELLSPEGIINFKIERMKEKSSNITFANPGENHKRVLVKSDAYLPCDSFIRALKL